MRSAGWGRQASLVGAFSMVAALLPTGADAVGAAPSLMVGGAPRVGSEVSELHAANLRRGLEFGQSDQQGDGSAPAPKPAIVPDGVAVEVVPVEPAVVSTLGDDVAVRELPSAVLETPVVEDVPPPAIEVEHEDLTADEVPEDAALKGFEPGRSVEDLERRDRFTSVFVNPDGTETYEVSALPVNYVDDRGEWRPVDNRVVSGPDGAFVNAANDWTVHFGVMRPGEGVRFSTPEGEFSFVADGAAESSPEVEPDGVSVRYREVFPGTDLVYRVHGAGIEEFLEVKHRRARSVVDFSFEGVEFRPVPSGLAAVGELESVKVSLPETFTAEGVPVDPSVHVFETRSAKPAQRRDGRAGSVVRVGVEPARLAELSDDAFPLIVDPNVTVTKNAANVRAYGNYLSGGGSFGFYEDGYARVGNPYLSASSSGRWRSVVNFPYSEYLGWTSVVDAKLVLSYSCCSGSGTQPIAAYWANQWGFHHGTAPRKVTQLAPPQSGYSLGWGTNYGYGTMGTSTSYVNGLGPLYNMATRTSTDGLALLLTGDESYGAYTLKKFSPKLRLTVNRWPGIPTLKKSTTGHTITWGAKNAVSDPDGDTVKYRHRLWRVNESEQWEKVKEFGWSTTRERTYMVPSQYRGSTIYAEVSTYDGTGQLLGEWHTHTRPTTRTASAATWQVGNLAPSSGSPTSPGAGASVHPPSATSPSVTFAGKVGKDGGDENDPLKYAFYLCNKDYQLPPTSDSGCSDKVLMHSWTSASPNATVSRSFSFASGHWGNTIRWGIATTDGFDTRYSSPRSFTLANSPAPEADIGMQPSSAWVDPESLTLSVDPVVDPDGDPVKYRFRICNQMEWSSNTTRCIESGDRSSPSWTVPSSAPLEWSKTNYWWVVTSDGRTATESGTKAGIVPQRSPASHPELGFGVQPNMRPVAGVNTANGNLTYTSTDLEVASATSPLLFERTYNSASDRVGAFGPGWTHTFAHGLDVDAGIGVTWRRPDGDAVFFGENPDGGYAIELGNNSVIAASPNDAPAEIAAAGTVGWQITRGDQSQLYFTAGGDLVGVVDSAGRSITITTAGNEQTVTDTATGRQLFIEWNANPALASSRIIAARTVPLASNSNQPLEWRYYYDASSRVERACDARDNTSTGHCYVFEWNTDDQIDRVVLPKGNTLIAVTYDAAGRVTTRSDGENNTWTYAYLTDQTFDNLPDPDDNNVVTTRTAAFHTTVTDPRGNADAFFYDDEMRLVHTDNFDDTAEYVAYDANGWQNAMSTAAASSPTPATTRTESERDGDIVKITDPDNLEWSADYSETNVLISSTAPDGTTTTVTSNAAGQPTSISTTGVGTETFSYTNGTEPVVGGGGAFQPPAMPRVSTGLDGVTTTFDYNEFGDLIRSAADTGVITEFTHDEIGRVLSETTTWPGGTSTYTFEYNELGQPTALTEPRVRNEISGQWHQAETTWVYDANTNPTSITVSDIEPASGGFMPDPPRTQTAEYDLNDRSWRLTNPEGHATSVVFDPAGNIIESIDELGRVTTTSYDSENRPTVVTLLDYVDPTNPGTPRDVTLSTTTYDQFGRVRNVTDPLGRTVQHDYDLAGRLWKRTQLDYQPVNGAPVDVVLEQHGYHPETGTLLWSETGNGTVHVDYGYDSSQRVNQITLRNTVPGYVSRDQVTTYTYDGSTAQLASETVTDGVTSSETRWGYDQYQRLTNVTVENGAADLTTTYTYDERGLAVAVTDPNGNTTTSSFDVLGRRWQTTHPTVAVTSYAAGTTTDTPTFRTGYNTFGEVTHNEDELGNLTTADYDRNGRPLSIGLAAYTPPGATAPLTPSIHSVYDPAGNVIQQTDRRGQVTDLTYDAFNRLAIATAPAATTGGTRPQELRRYDDAGNPTWTRNMIGAETITSYDDLNRVRTVTEIVRNGTNTPDQYTSSYDHNWLNLPIKRVDPTNTVVFTGVYSPAGNLLAATDALGHTTTTEYDHRDQPVRVTDPAGRYELRSYDPAGRVTATSRHEPNNQAVAQQNIAYDLNGNITGIIDANGHGPTYSYDELGRLSQVTEPIASATNIVTSYGYDARGQLTSVHDGNGNTWWNTYTPWGTIESQIEPATSAHPTLADRTFTYIPEVGGNIVEIRQPGNVNVARTLDHHGRLVNEHGGTSGGDRTINYDLAGRITTIASGSTQLDFTYDDRNQLLQTSGSAGTTSFGYDPAGRMTQRSDLAGTTNYTWTPRSQLHSVHDPLTDNTTTNTWNPEGTLAGTTTTTPTGNVVRTLDWDAANRLTGDLLTDTNSQPVRDVTYTYDNNGNLTTRTTAPATLAGHGTDTYTYDWSNRLTSWTAPDTTVTNYAYDNNGNLTTNGTTNNTYDERNRQLTNGTTTNTWTPRGTLATRTTSNGTTTYTHDGLNQLIVAGNTTYTYDGLGRTNQRDSTTFTYSGLDQQPIHDGTNTSAHDPFGQLVAVQTPNAALNTITDRHTDLAATFDNTGAVIDSIAYDPWGSTLTTTGPSQLAWGFQSDYTDPDTGFINMGARWYDTTSTFTTRDTYNGATQQPVTLNRYTYANNNPNSYHDPSGRCGIRIDGMYCASSFSRPTPKPAPKPTNRYAPKTTSAIKKAQTANYYASRYGTQSQIAAAAKYHANTPKANYYANKVRAAQVKNYYADKYQSHLTHTRNTQIKNYYQHTYKAPPPPPPPQKCSPLGCGIIGDIGGAIAAGGKAVGNAAANAATGAGSAVVNTGNAINHAVTNPVETAKAAVDLSGYCLNESKIWVDCAYMETIGKPYAENVEQNGYIHATTQLATETVIGIGAGKALKPLTTTDDLTQLANQLDNPSNLARGAPNKPGGVDGGLVHGPVKPGEVPISVQQQAGHIPGTPQYANRLKVNKPTSAWDPAIDADAYTQYTWANGTPAANNANIRTFDFDHPVGAGGFGGTQFQVTVSMNPTTGAIHGYPSGPVTP